MRNGISLVVIALALASILAGFLSGQHASHPPPTVVLHAARAATTPAPGLPHETDAHTVDLFSDDDVVVERPLAAVANWQPERLAIVVGLCGQSVAVESGFLRLGDPMAFDLDPNAAEAAKFAQFVRESGDPLYVHLGSAPTSAQLDALRARIGAFDGVASRSPRGMTRALAGTGLAFFDERGDADARAFAQANVSLIRRDFTVDNRTAPTYVSYMLERAAARSARAGAVVVLMRPMPSSLDALAAFTRSRAIDLAATR